MASHPTINTESEHLKVDRRRLILRDSVAFAILVLGVSVLFAVTLFLFRSFTAHRAVLADQWSVEGSNDLKANKPDAAITAFRTALIYAPDTHAYQLQLAQALGESNCSGCQDESYNYYMNLGEAEPGNGVINLALARLAARRNDRGAAINYYHASIYGTWEGNGVDHRADVRIELAKYQMQAQNFAEARLELLTAGSNAPDSFDRDMTVAALLQQAQDPADAWAYYQKAIADKPTDAAALSTAGNMAYESGDYQKAEHLLDRALEEADKSNPPVALPAQTHDRMENASRILDLIPSSTMPLRERVARILAARTIAKQRYDSCSSQFSVNSPLPLALEALNPRWSAEEGTANSVALQRDSALQDAAMQLVFDTEKATAAVCSAATGDDALLLTVANSPNIQLSTAGRTSQFIAPID